MDDRIEYLKFLSAPAAWMSTGDRLMASAEALWARIDAVFSEDTEASRVQAASAALYYGNSFLLLAGFGVENYIKALIVKRQPGIANLTAQQASLPRILRTHDLVALAERAELPREVFDAELLTRFTRATTWRGRYPVPLAVEARIGHMQISPPDFDHALAIRREVRSIVYSPQDADASLFGLEPTLYDGGGA